MPRQGKPASDSLQAQEIFASMVEHSPHIANVVCIGQVQFPVGQLTPTLFTEGVENAAVMAALTARVASL